MKVIRISYRLILNLLALAVFLFGVSFNTDYFIYINSKRLTPVMTAMLWSGQILWIVALFLFLFFKSFLIKKRKQIGIFLVSLLILLVTVEAVFRIVDKRPPKYSPHHYLNFYGTPNYQSMDGLNRHNSLGLRGPEIAVPKPQGVYRLAVLGGSTVYEEAVADWRKDFARQLEKELKKLYRYEKIEVINAGLVGYTSWEDLINLEFRLLDLSPDFLILYPGTNDVHARFVDPKSYKSDNSGKVKQWEKKACLFIFCLRIVERLTGIDPGNFDVGAPTFFLPNEVPVEAVSVGLTPREILKRNPPVFFEHNLRNMIAIAREHEIGVMLATWAHSDRFHDYAATAYYEQGFAENNEVVKRVGNSHSLPVYDFALQMPMKEKYWADGRHNNEEGVAKKAELFANFIATNKLINQEIEVLK